MNAPHFVTTPAPPQHELAAPGINGPTAPTSYWYTGDPAHSPMSVGDLVVVTFADGTWLGTIIADNGTDVTIEWT